MSWEILFVLGLLVVSLASFLLEKIPADQTAISIFALIVVASMLPFASKLPTMEQLLTVFSSAAPVTIAAMFILSAGLEKCGAIEKLSSALRSITHLGYRSFLLLLTLLVAGISAFINNTPVVMVFLPAVLGLSRSLGVPASKLLIPLSYASIFGGTCTLVGTSTNILASSILERTGAEPIAMFELAKVGLPLLGVGTLYLVLFSKRLLPERETLTSILSEEERKEFITEAFVQRGSPMIGRPVAESNLLKERSVRVLQIVRDDIALEDDDPKDTVLQEGDRLILACRPSGFAHARSIDGIALSFTRNLGLETISAHEGSIVEGVIGPKSTLVGQTMAEVNFRQRFRMVVLAIHRRGVNLRKKLEAVRLEPGDLLLLMGTDPAIEQLRLSDEILLLDHPRTPSLSLRKKTPLVVGTVMAVIVVAALNWVPIVGAAMVGAAFLFFTGCLKPKEGYENIEWSILFLIYGMLGLGLAMQTTGTADLVAGMLNRTADLPIFTEGVRPYVLLAAIYLCTMILTETLSNNATVVLMTPIALSLGTTVGVDSRPFVIATCIAASASFSTPIGYQTNTYVYGVAGYRFTDFTKAGLPLNLLYFVLSVLLIPQFWSF